jgi:hypothetical protein
MGNAPSQRKLCLFSFPFRPADLARATAQKARYSMNTILFTIIRSVLGSDAPARAGALAAFLIGAFNPCLHAATFSDANWASMGGYPGANGSVRATVVDGSGNLYIGGQFTMVGDVFANGIAKWNGSSWSALGSGINSGYGWVYALAVSGNDLYAAGYFPTAGGSAVNHIAKWDGTNWSALGAGLHGPVYAVAVSGTNVYAGGQKWNGSSWSPLGYLDGTVLALAVSGSELYAGGNFRVGGASSHIARWSGSNWITLGSGMNNQVSALAVSGGNLYAGGYFTTAGGIAANRIAKWNGSSWSAIGSGMADGVSALAVSGSDLYASGVIRAPDNSTSSYIAKWNGSSWSQLGSEITGGYYSQGFALAVSGNDLYAGGEFWTWGGNTANGIAKWNGSNWSAPGSGLNGDVSALAVSGGELYLGGQFTTAGSSAANRIVQWNGSSWNALGSGLNSNVSALAASGSDLYAGGEFTMAGGSAANRIAKWNGSNWSPLGSGMNGNVSALAISGGDLYAGGEFTTAGGMAANHVAKWNGSSWNALGSGVSAPEGYPYYGGRVAALAVLGSDLYAGGYFTNAGGSTANYIARWDGSSWSALGSGMGGGDGYPHVFALAVSGSDLYAGGGFTTAGGSAANYIAKWNGSSWSALGSGMQGNYDYWATVYALEVSGNDVYAGGGFEMAGRNWANRIAKWDGSRWSRLGSGLNSTVRALAVSGSDLYAGGYFTTAGTKVSASVARADLASPTEPPFADVTVTVAPDLPALASSSVAWADYDNDGRLDFLLTGLSFYYLPVSQIWRNTGSGFTNVTATIAPGLPQVTDGSVAWADYDNDGRFDFLITGYSYTADYQPVSQLWRNTGNGFEDVTATVAPGLPGVSASSVAWGDYDDDGRVDFLITGFKEYLPGWQPIYVSQLWRNTGSAFTNVTATVAPGVPGVSEGSVAWGDYDNDGRLDFLLTGGIQRRSDLDDYWPYLTGIAQLWRNTGSGFVNVTDAVVPDLPGVFWSSVAWADYDNDGWQDFLLTGFNFGFAGEEVSAFNSFSQLWRNTGNGFVKVTETVAPGLPGVHEASVAWGDYDNDGRLDFLLATGGGSQLWRNTGSGFTNVTASVAPGLPPLIDSSVAWADYDNDGRLDMLLTGAVSGYCDVCQAPPRTSQLWRNQTGGTNPSPAIITGLPSSVSQAAVTLNARINPLGDAANAWFIWGDSANYGNATTPQPVGNGISFSNFSDTITGLSTGVTYYYRAVGSNGQGRVSIGDERRFTLAPPPTVTTGAAGNLSPSFATFNGHINPGNLSTYGWFEWGFTPAFGEMTSVRLLGGGLAATLTLNVSNLEGGRTYYFRAVGSNSFGVAYGAVQSFVTPTFANVTDTVTPDLAQLGYSSVAWGDYDNDGRLDFILSGYFYDEVSENDFYLSQIWRNTVAGFVNVTATVAPGLDSFGGSAVEWCDYDNDGRLDLLSTGNPYNDDTVSQVWRNTAGGFTNVTDIILPGLLRYGHGAWGDYDNDGRPDLLVIGYTHEGVLSSQVWRNTGSGFTDVKTNVAPGLPGVAGVAVAWGDYDNDGWLDFLLTGSTNSPSGHYSRICQLWRNTGRGFTNVTATVAPALPGVEGRPAWADYDSDGRLDFFITGTTNGFYDGPISQLWRNTGSAFTNVTATVAPGLQGVSGGSVAWGDYDNDGRLDFLLTGYTSNGNSRVAQVWRNTESGFENVTATVVPSLPEFADGAVAWGDYDNDGRLDLLVTGYGAWPSDFISQIWRNYTPVTNTPPTAPTGLAMTASSNAVMLSWNSATDDQTPASGLTYNVRAGTTPGGNNLLSAHVNATNGFRRVPALGNAMLRHSLPLAGLTNGQTVYWSVQAVDSAFAGGPFATETSVVSLPVLSVSINSSASAQSSGATAPKQSEGGQPSTLNLSWTPPTFGWVLQQNPNLNVNTWTNTPSGSVNPATLPATNGAQFYRLSKP